MVSHAMQKARDENNADNEWRLYAKCRGVDPNVFHITRTNPVTQASLLQEARSYCDVCPVREQCLEYALVHNIKYGIYGGLTEKQRQDVKRARKVA